MTPERRHYLTAEILLRGEWADITLEEQHELVTDYGRERAAERAAERCLAVQLAKVTAERDERPCVMCKTPVSLHRTYKEETGVRCLFCRDIFCIKCGFEHMARNDEERITFSKHELFRDQLAAERARAERLGAAIVLAVNRPALADPNLSTAAVLVAMLQILRAALAADPPEVRP